MAYTKEQIDAAIDAEAKDWAAFFNVVGDHEERKSVMRANVFVGYFEPLLPYLPEPEELVFHPVGKPETIAINKIEPQASGDWHDKPLRWSVTGPRNEVQKFPTWKDARTYAKIRRKASSQNEAIKRFADYVEI